MVTRIVTFAFGLAVVACGGDDTGPRLIAGGGVADGSIDGKVYVHVIDGETELPIGNATVGVAGVEDTTDETGFVEFGDVDGPQTISVKLAGYRSTVWAGVNGTNVTIPVRKLATAAPPQATLSGSITGWDTITVPAQHIKAAVVLYSQTDDLGDPGNSLATPAMGNICGVGQAQCNWSVVTRTGALTLAAAIVDRDTKGTLTPDDDTQAIIGWATRTGVTVEAGVNQSGLPLTIVEAGNLETVTIDYGTPPAALSEKFAIVGIEIDDDEVLQLPLFLLPGATTLLAPKRSVFGAEATYRLTAIAQTAQGDLGGQSIVLRRGLTSPTLAAGAWLVPPTGVSATRTGASWQPVADAKLHTVGFDDTLGNPLLEITVFDRATTTVDVPALVALPVSGALTVRVGGIGASIDLQDFSLDEDDDELFAIAAQAAAVP